MIRRTKGTIEADIANAVVRFQREQQGRGPSDVRVHLVGDMLLIRSGGIFTPTESHLAATDEGRRLIRSARHELRGIHHAEIEQIVAEIIGCKVKRSYCDVDVLAAEQIEVYVLMTDIERQLLRQELDLLGVVSPV